MALPNGNGIRLMKAECPKCGRRSYWQEVGDPGCDCPEPEVEVAQEIKPVPEPPKKSWWRRIFGS